MSDYTIKNFKDLDDVAADRGVDMEARFARSHIDSAHLGPSYFRYGAGVRGPFGHSHKEQEEVYVVIGGAGKAKLDDEIVELKKWDVVRVSPGVVRAFEGGPEGLELIAVGSDRPEGGDGVPAPGFWDED